MAANAILGADGFFHLANDGRTACVSHSVSPAVAMRVFKDRSDVVTNIDRHGWIKWEPRLLEECAPAVEVSQADQCPASRGLWPGTLTGLGKLVALRRALVDRFGPLCVICGDAMASRVDHDHQTGIIRGYLCRDCNTIVDDCRHLDGCPFANYLNHPPAAVIALKHPDADSWLKAPKYVGRRAQFDRIMRGGTSRGVGLPGYGAVGLETAGGTTGAREVSAPKSQEPQTRDSTP